MNTIEIKDLTKDYGHEKGIFNLSFSVQEGEVFGFLGPNGAGKTTTIRQLLGFTNPTNGHCYINGLDARINTVKTLKSLGYIPGEIAFFEDLTGIDFIKFMAKYRGLDNLDRAYELIKRFDLDPKGKIRKMSKGTKQKVGIVVAFMHNPKIIILDEPTSGLDPLMQQRFIELIKEEKKQGKTIIMSSHIFEEVEKTCDKVAIIKDGRLVTIDSVKALKEKQITKYQIIFKQEKDLNDFKEKHLDTTTIDSKTITVICKNDLNELLKDLTNYDIVSLTSLNQTLEEIFMHYYGGNHD